MAKRKPAAKANGHANEQEPNQATVGDNTRTLDAATFFNHLREIESAERKKSTAVANLRNAYKRASEIGINVARLRDARKLREFTEPELAEELNTLITYSQHLKVPVYGDLPFATVTSPTEDDVVTNAHDRGLVAGRCGEPSDANPWTLDTPAGREWAKARDQGADEYKRGFA
jgi:uncharacterized protein (UPF0335 family)